MRQVDFTSSDGRRALLAFTGTDSLAAWDSSARPVPRRAFIAAQGVLEAEYDALVIDLAGPIPVAIDGPVLARLAIGPKRAEQLRAALDACCARIGEIPGVHGVGHVRDGHEIRVVVEVDHAREQFAEAIPAALDDPALTVLLDVPLSVEVVTGFAPGHSGALT